MGTGPPIQHAFLLNASQCNWSQFVKPINTPISTELSDKLKATLHVNYAQFNHISFPKLFPFQESYEASHSLPCSLASELIPLMQTYKSWTFIQTNKKSGIKAPNFILYKRMKYSFIKEFFLIKEKISLIQFFKPLFPTSL